MLYRERTRENKFSLSKVVFVSIMYSKKDSTSTYPSTSKLTTVVMYTMCYVQQWDVIQRKKGFITLREEFSREQNSKRLGLSLSSSFYSLHKTLIYIHICTLASIRQLASSSRQIQVREKFYAHFVSLHGLSFMDISCLSFLHGYVYLYDHVIYTHDYIYDHLYTRETD